MKKIFSLILAVALVAALGAIAVSAEVDPTIGINRNVTIYEIKTAPVVDGTVADGEYGDPIAHWPGDTVMQSRGDYAEKMTADIYMTYDADYIYYAVVTECDEPHVAYVLDDDDHDHYIFNAHHVMSLIIPDDPSKDIYPGSSATWGELYSGGYCYEWTMICDSNTKQTVTANHFGGLMDTAGVECVCTSADGFDTYEIKLPWTAMKSTVQPEALTGEDGTVFGFDFDIGLTDIGEGYDTDDRGNYIYFGGCYTNEEGKNINGCAIVTCAGEKVAEESSEPAAESSSAASEEPTNPTSDSGIIALAVIAALAVAGAVAVKKSR